MRHVLVVLAVAALALPAGAVTANFSTTVDGSFSAYDGEGYTSTTYANDLSVRVAKGNQHYGFVGWTGTTKQDMANFVGSNTITGAYLNVRAVVGQWDWNTTPLPTMTGVTGSAFTNKAAIITMRTGNTGEIVEDTQDFDWACCIDNLGAAGDYAPASLDHAGGSTMPMAWRMADTEMKNPGRYVNYGDGIDKFAMGAYAGVPWKRPSTGDPAGIGSGKLTGLVPGSDVYWTAGTSKRGFGGLENNGGDGLMAFEAALGMTNSQAGNDIARFEKAGQLVNKDANGNFVWMNDYAVGDGWYRIPITPEIAADLINNPECKGLLFDGYVAGANANGNDEFARHVSDSGAYLTLDVTPEPMTLTLLALGGLGLLRRRNA